MVSYAIAGFRFSRLPADAVHDLCGRATGRLQP